MKLTIAFKLSLAAVLLVLVSVILVGGLFYSKTTELLVEQAIDDIAGEIRNAGSHLQANIDAQREDTKALAGTPPIQGMLRALKANNFDMQGNSTYQQWEQRLQSIFTTMLESKPLYLTIRFIDNNGQERVVVSHDSGKPIIMGDEQLQNKLHRNYVNDTLKLSAGSLYLSEINLNREHGLVSEPRQEVLRSATPIYDNQYGEIAGLLVIVAEIGQEFREIQSLVQDESSKIYITNDHGDYLLHPDGNKSFGFDIGKRYLIQKDFPRLATLYLSGNHDKNVTLLPEDDVNQNVINFTKIHFDPDRPERFVAVGVTQLYDNILANHAGVLNNVLSLAVVMAMLVTLLAIIFALRLSRPIKLITQVMDDYTHQRETTTLMPMNQHDEIGILARSYIALIKQVDEARSGLEEMNQNLESIVAERTQALEKSELFQRGIVETMVDGLITIDDKGIITSFNTAATKIFGYRSEEVVGNNVSMLMPAPYRLEHDSYLNNYHQSGLKKIIGIGRELEGQRKDGSTFPMDLAIGEISVNAQPTYSGVIRDISERKLMDTMKNEFVSTVSHELRTPLTAIRGSLGLINSGVVGDLPEKAKELLEIAGNNTERLLLLINDILDIQKIESGHMAFKFQNMDLKSFLEQALEENKAYGEQYDVEFILASKIKDIQLFADKDRLMQVLANLLSNAAKFSPKNDKILVNVSRNINNSIRISVTDHGSGIPEEFQSRIFDKFTQSDSSTTRQKGGTGLGLSISKAIVEKHDGRIGFVSHEGLGTTFFIDLPK